MSSPGSIASRDKNRVPTLVAVSDVDFATPVTVAANPTTGALDIAGTITATNPSVSTTGAAVPGSATYIGVNSGGNLVGLTEGQATMANSIPVVVASDQTAINVLQPDATVVTGNITNTQSVTFTNNGYGTIGVNIAGTYTGTIVIEGSVDGTNYNSTTLLTLASGSPVTSVTAATGNYQGNVSGLKTFRLRGNTVASGTANITLRGNVGVSNVMLDNAIPTGANTIGNVGINGGSNNIGSVNTRDGAGNALTSNSTTTVAKVALDTNILSILGTAPTTAGVLDVKSSSATGAHVPSTAFYIAAGDNSGNLQGASTAYGDAQSAGATFLAVSGVYNGSNIDRLKSANGANNTTGTGLLGSSPMGFDGTNYQRITTNSTTFSSKNGLDTNLLGTLGTAFTTAGKVDVKATQKQSYGTYTAMTVTNLQSLASSATAGWQSARVDNQTSTLALDYHIFVKLTTANSAPANDKAMYVYVSPAITTDGGTTWLQADQGTATLPTGTEGTTTIASPNDLKLLGVLSYTTQNMTVQGSFLLSNAVGRNMPDGFSLIIINFSGAALSTSCVVAYRALNTTLG